MTEPEDPGDRPGRRNVLVDVAAWAAAIAFCLGLPATAVIFWAKIAAPVTRAGEAVLDRAPGLPRVKIRPAPLEPCDVPILSSEEFEDFVRLDPPGRVEGERVPLTWLERPRPHFPTAMMDRGVEQGSVRLACRISAEGKVKACRVVEETTPGLGMAEAAVASMCDARLQPMTVGGEPQPATMKVTISFRM